MTFDAKSANPILTLTLRQVIQYVRKVRTGMENADTFDITAVCNDLGVSSRTLRYYEEIGLIESTKSDCSKRRRYTREQIEKIQVSRSMRISTE